MAILISSDVAKRFRTVAAKCRPTRTRDPALPVLANVQDGILTLFVSFGEVDLARAAPTTGRNSSTVVSLDDLDRTDALGLPARTDPDRSNPDSFVPTIPVVPDRMPEVSPLVLSAFHEAGKSAARDTSRYAITRIQLQGKTGKIVGTDGKQALVQSGFKFPFLKDLLVPAVRVFGCKDLASQADVHIGRTDTHVVVTAGPWTVWLLIETEGRFPDIKGAVPRTRLTTTLDVGLPAGLADVLRALPGEDDEGSPVTLELGPRPVVRAEGTGKIAASEMPIAEATVTGPPLAVVVNRENLLRALALGFHQFRFAGADRSWVATDPTRTYLSATLGPPTSSPAPTATPAAESTPTPETLRRLDMPARDTPPPPPTRNGHADSPNGDAADPLAEAEALRTALTEAAARAHRLVQALKDGRRQKRALSSALGTLRSLRVGP